MLQALIAKKPFAAQTARYSVLTRIDTIADVYLNGEMIGSPDNMHRTWEYDVTEEVKEKDNELRIVFHSPTKYIAEAFEVSETQRTAVRGCNGWLCKHP